MLLRPANQRRPRGAHRDYWYCFHAIGFPSSRNRKNIRKNSGLMTQVEDAGQRRASIGGKRLAQRGFLPGTGGQNPDLARGSNGRVPDGDSVGRRLGSNYRPENDLAAHRVLGFAREERSDMAVLTHAEKNQVQYWLAAGG